MSSSILITSSTVKAVTAQPLFVGHSRQLFISCTAQELPAYSKRAGGVQPAACACTCVSTSGETPAPTATEAGVWQKQTKLWRLFHERKTTLEICVHYFFYVNCDRAHICTMDPKGPE